MKRILAISFGMLLTALISMSLVNSVRADISSPSWVAALNKNYSDEFFGSWVNVAYKTGSSALLIVPVYSDWYVGHPYNNYRPVNVSAVKVGFDWGVNYTSTEASMTSPVQIQPHQTHNFNINFTIPATTVASNLVMHRYTIYVEHINATTGPKKIVHTWTYESNNFAVCSADQGDAIDLRSEYNAYGSLYFSTANASSLLVKARVEASTGTTNYMRGNFADAKRQYQTALDLIAQALTAEVDRRNSVEDIQVDSDKKQAEAAVTEANAAQTKAYGWLVFGVGGILIGVGVIAFAVRRPKA